MKKKHNPFTIIRNWISGSIRNKMIFFVILVFVILYAFTLTYNYIRMKNNLLDSSKKEALSTAQIIVTTIYRNYELPDDARGLQSYVVGITRYKKNILELTVIDKEFFILSSSIEDKLDEEMEGKEYEMALNENKRSVKIVNEKELSYIRILLPISAGTGTNLVTTGAVLLKTDIKYQLEYLANNRNTIIVSGVLIIFVIFLVILLISTSITKPIKTLFLGLSKIQEGNLDVVVPVTSKDEIGFLSNSFNDMVASIKDSKQKLEDHAMHLEKLNIAFSRFVPREFLGFLGHNEITEVQLGDQIQKDMAILFVDIRSFTTMSERMSPKENFDFLNAYLKRVVPVIRENHGFIDKYIGDAVMALFPDKVEDAVKSAIGIQKAVAEYNVHRKKSFYSPIRIGVGVHTGNLMLGTIGDEKHMQGTVIADAVNLASRIEGLTKIFGASIVISERILQKLHDTEKFSFRFLGFMKARGKQLENAVYEIFDSDEPKVIKLKMQTKEDFKQAVDYYQNEEFDKALKIFKDIQKVNDKDKPVSLYIERCEKKEELVF